MVKLIDVTLRDGQQSLIATRLSTEDIVKVAELLDKAGFYALEVWGGATFDAALRFLNEDPWIRLKRVREAVKRTKLLMLLRGMNLVGYRHYPQDVVKKFIEYAYRDGIDIFRVFDALNDPNNLEFPIKVIRDLGAELQVCLVYSVSPVHTTEYYVKLAQDIVARFEPETITIKDMAGLLTPYIAVELVKELKRLGVRVNVHTHSTCGLAPMTLLKSVEAGADFVDVALSSLSLYTSHTPAESLIAALKGTKYDPGVDLEVLYMVSRMLWEIRKKYKDYDYVLKAPPVDVSVLKHQIPGGMLSNLIAQLKELKADNRINEVLDEVNNVRKDLGWPPLVTPISQIVATQAVLNVLSGRRYGAIVSELIDYVEGKYGRPPAPISKVLLKLIKSKHNRRAHNQVITLERALNDMPKELVRKFEDYITYALFPNEAINTLRKLHSITTLK